MLQQGCNNQKFDYIMHVGYVYLHTLIYHMQLIIMYCVYY